MNCPSCDHDIAERFCPWCGHDSQKGKPITVQMDARVYVVQHQTKDGAAKFDLRPAEQFGRLVFCLDADAKPFNHHRVIRQLHERLRDIRKHDYLLLLGNPCLIGWATTIAAHYSGGILNLLQWERRDQAYEVIRADILMWS